MCSSEDRYSLEAFVILPLCCGPLARRICLGGERGGQALQDALPSRLGRLHHIQEHSFVNVSSK